jgi:hypothetical protein
MKDIKIKISLKEHFEFSSAKDNMDAIDCITGFMDWKEHVSYFKKQVSDYLETEQEFGQNQELIDAYNVILKQLK